MKNINCSDGVKVGGRMQEHFLKRKKEATMFLSWEAEALPWLSRAKDKLGSPIPSVIAHENRGRSVPEELQVCKRAFSQQQDEALPMATKGAHKSTISACSTHWEHLPCPKNQVPVHQALPPLHPTLSCSCNAFSPSSLA